MNGSLKALASGPSVKWWLSRFGHDPDKGCEKPRRYYDCIWDISQHNRILPAPTKLISYLLLDKGAEFHVRNTFVQLQLIRPWCHNSDVKYNWFVWNEKYLNRLFPDSMRKWKLSRYRIFLKINFTVTNCLFWSFHHPQIMVPLIFRLDIKAFFLSPKNSTQKLSWWLFTGVGRRIQNPHKSIYSTLYDASQYFWSQ